MELTNELLIEEYTKNKLSLTKLSQKYSISRYFISKRLMDLGISINDEFNSNLKHDKLKSLDYNTFYSLYSINNKSYKEIADLYGVTERQIKRLNVEKYHCTKTKSQSQSTRAKTMQKIYGTTTYAKSEHYKQNKSKYEQTRVDTVMRKYGVKNVFQLDSIKEKSKQSHLNRYGVSNYSQINKDPKSIEVAYDKDKLTKIITSLKPSERTRENIANTINYSYSATCDIINKLCLDDLVISIPKQSSYEIEIINIIKSFGITNIKTNDRTILDGKEIDIYLPDYKLGIEFNGNYWHSDACESYKDNGGRSKRNQEKSILAESKGIFIYNIFEYEWTSCIIKPKIINMLKNILQQNTVKIQARKCDIRDVSTKDKQTFLKKYHIQGGDKSKYNYGLYYNNELVSLMTFCSSRFSHGKQKWELSRFCSKSDTNVIGAAGKLFKYFVDTIMEKDEECVTYNDFTKTRGSLYEHLGFEFKHLADPNYVWWNPYTEEIKTRYQCRMKNENQVMHANKFYRICDSGNKVWIYKKAEE